MLQAEAFDQAQADIAACFVPFHDHQLQDVSVQVGNNRSIDDRHLFQAVPGDYLPGDDFDDRVGLPAGR